MIRIVANYVMWRFVRHRINNLDKRFQEAQQELYRNLYGREETPPRLKFCVAYGNGNLGNSVGALFVKKYFDEGSKADVPCYHFAFLKNARIRLFVSSTDGDFN
ncbi:MAG: M13 family metallopeptidase N-terminal domain-containing protein [Nitrospinaceae bacterium]